MGDNGKLTKVYCTLKSQIFSILERNRRMGYDFVERETSLCDIESNQVTQDKHQRRERKKSPPLTCSVSAINSPFILSQKKNHCPLLGICNVADQVNHPSAAHNKHKTHHLLHLLRLQQKASLSPSITSLSSLVKSFESQ